LNNKTQCEHTNKTEKRAIELGHCFLLGDRYTKAFNATEGSSDITAEKRLKKRMLQYISIFLS
jgi:prolyl-tRNA synthetase